MRALRGSALGPALLAHGFLVVPASIDNRRGGRFSKRLSEIEVAFPGFAARFGAHRKVVDLGRRPGEFRDHDFVFSFDDALTVRLG